MLFDEKRRELEIRSSTVDVDTGEITEAFRKGKELLMSDQLPRIKPLIELYVSRVEVYPEHVTVKLNYISALQAGASNSSLGRLGDTYEKALEFKENIDRKMIIRADGRKRLYKRFMQKITVLRKNRR